MAGTKQENHLNQTSIFLDSIFIFQGVGDYTLDLPPNQKQWKVTVYRDHILNM